MTTLNPANLGRKQQCPHCVHYEMDNSIDLCQMNRWPEKACEPKATT